MAVPVYYTMLGLDPRATDDEIHSAFHRLAGQYLAAGEGANTLAARRFRLIKEAYAVLGNPVRRAAYDAQLSGVRYAPQPAIAPKPAAGPPIEEHVPEPPPPSASGKPAIRRLALGNWLRRHPTLSAAVTALLLLLQFGALEQPHHTATSRRPATPTLPGAPYAGAPLIAAFNRPSSTAGPRHTARASATISGRSSPTSIRASATATPGRSTARIPANHRIRGSATPSTQPKIPQRGAVRVTPSPQAKGNGEPSASSVAELQPVKQLAEPRIVAALPVFLDRRLDAHMQCPTRDTWQSALPPAMLIGGRQSRIDLRRLRLESPLGGMRDLKGFYNDVSRIRQVTWGRRSMSTRAFGGHGPLHRLADRGRSIQA